ncbi:MAG: hypothetical protein QGF00_34610 [Planctomycetota bacterium]|jgi:hypothetical protein|nr:hypothetical protein [Planctomycetota bacterium]MDP7254780.1 hypothetical protein [Planctomycetota bacterium]
MSFNASDIRDISIPVQATNWNGLYAGHDKNGRPTVYAAMGQQADNFFVLQISPDTGELRQFMSEVDGSNFPTAKLMSRTGKLYVGSAYAGHLHCFDPGREVFENLGALNPKAASFPCKIVEDEEGVIWVGSFGTADLTSFHPDTGEFVRHGRMDDVDMYLYPSLSHDGKIASVVRMTKPKVVVFDPKTSEKRVVGPVTIKGESTLTLVEAEDGYLYISSSPGNFRIEGWEAVPVDDVPEARREPILSDGRRFRFGDSNEQLFRKLEVINPDGSSNVFDLDFEAKGTEIFYLHLGPDNKIYGSSILPLHFFRYDPETDETVNFGKASESTGEAYSMANLDGKVYLASYPAANLSVYDPEQPYHYGTTEGENPQHLGRMDDVSYRPRSTLTGPQGKVWTASVPDYGMWGGPLAWYHPQTGERDSYRYIAGEASCYTLAHLEHQKLVAVGTTIRAGSGTEARVDQAVLILWDYDEEEKVWEGTLEQSLSVFNSLLTHDGRLLGTAVGGDFRTIFVFDADSRAFTDLVEIPAGRPLDHGLQHGPDGIIYGMTSSCVYTLDPDTMETKVLVDGPDEFQVVGPVVGDTIYFGTNHRLRSVRLR